MGEGKCDWRTTCQPVHEDNKLTDPRYDEMKWAYQLIDVEPVWERGITGRGIHIRVNDDGVDSKHPEFIPGGIDGALSCEDYHEPRHSSDTPGTYCASLIGSAGNNDECAVGIAPDVTISSCKMLGDNPVTKHQNYDHKIEKVDISSNSLGRPRAKRKASAFVVYRRLVRSVPHFQAAHVKVARHLRSMAWIVKRAKKK